MTPLEQARMDRMEGKIDKLSDVLVSLARSEERVITLFKQHEDMYMNLAEMRKALAEQDDRLNLIDRVDASRATIYRWIDRIAVMFTTGSVAYLLAKINGGKIP